jgi:ribosomal subunit interface protein
MQIIIEGQGLDIGASLRTYVEEKITQIAEHYFDHTIHATIIFSLDARKVYNAEIALAVGNGITLNAEAQEHEIYPAFDHAANRIKTQLRRYKGRLRDHHRRMKEANRLEAATVTKMILQAEPDHGHDNENAEHTPVVIAEMTTTIETLDVGEAVMRMDLTDAPALMFNNRQTGQLNMVYRRKDGNISWVDPQNMAAKKVA